MCGQVQTTPSRSSCNPYQSSGAGDVALAAGATPTTPATLLINDHDDDSNDDNWHAMCTVESNAVSHSGPRCILLNACSKLWLPQQSVLDTSC